MAAKVLLGIVALTAIVGSPFAYNHFKSPSGETQKEEGAKNEQPSAEKSANAAPEVKADKPAVNEQVPDKNEGAQGPATDPCDLGGAQTWSATGSSISPKSQCVSRVVKDKRQENQH